MPIGHPESTMPLEAQKQFILRLLVVEMGNLSVEGYERLY
jgi:hypothetical protein